MKSFKLKDNSPRLVLLGNSNVGKSSIVKYLLKNKKLTAGKIGKRAGSTTKLNLYKDPALAYQIVDLPGFGAMVKTSKVMKEKIHTRIIQYVEEDRENIFLALIILNCLRINDELQKWYYGNKKTIPLSYEFVKWLNEVKIPSIVILNKIDRVKKRDLLRIQEKVKTTFSELGIKIGEIEEKTKFTGILSVSAKKHINMGNLKDLIKNYFGLKFPE
ncbi:MAG: GTPase [Promethearchaeota archaeon]